MRRLAVLLGLGLLGLVPVAEPAAAAAPRISISDRTDLVHGQELVVRGENFDPGLFSVTTAVCADPVDDDRCEQIGWQQVGANGRWTMRAVVDVYLDLFYTPPVDCRVERCWLVIRGHGVFPEPPPIVRSATFDPAGPDPARRPVRVTPDEDLVDGSVLRVQGEGFRGGGVPRAVSMVPCRLPMTVHADCDGRAEREVRIARDGILDTTFRVDAVIALESGSWDCRTSPCALLVLDGGAFVEPFEDFSEAGLVPLHFNPDAPLRAPPSGSVTPSTGLVDDQPVQVEATGFDPDERIWIQQCVLPVEDWWDPDRCHAERPGTMATTDETGSLARRYNVFTTLIDWFDPFDCRVETCGLVLTQTSPYRRLVLPIDFDPDAPELEPQVTVTPSRNLRDGQLVTVEGTGFRAWTRIWFLQCPPGNYPGDTVGCDLRTRARHWTGAPDGGEPGESFTLTYRVRRQLRDRECGTRPCVLHVLSIETIPDAFDLPLRFRPS